MVAIMIEYLTQETPLHTLLIWASEVVGRMPLRMIALAMDLSWYMIAILFQITVLRAAVAITSRITWYIATETLLVLKFRVAVYKYIT